MDRGDEIVWEYRIVSPEDRAVFEVLQVDRVDDHLDLLEVNERLEYLAQGLQLQDCRGTALRGAAVDQNDPGTVEPDRAAR